MARLTKRHVNRWASNPVETQKKQLNYLIKKALRTSFGQKHNFTRINNYNDFKNHVPVRDYEDLREYFEQIKEGTKNVLWPGKPLYLAVTSGTTSGSKYIPITKQSLPNHLNGAKTALLMYVAETGKVDFVNGKFIFIQGSPVLSKISGILTEGSQVFLLTTFLFI